MIGAFPFWGVGAFGVGRFFVVDMPVKAFNALFFFAGAPSDSEEGLFWGGIFDVCLDEIVPTSIPGLRTPFDGLFCCLELGCLATSFLELSVGSLLRGMVFLGCCFFSSWICCFDKTTTRSCVSSGASDSGHGMLMLGNPNKRVPRMVVWRIVEYVLPRINFKILPVIINLIGGGNNSYAFV